MKIEKQLIAALEAGLTAGDETEWAAARDELHRLTPGITAGEFGVLLDEVEQATVRQILRGMADELVDETRKRIKDMLAGCELAEEH